MKKFDDECFLIYCKEGIENIYDLGMVRDKIQEIIKNLIREVGIKGSWVLNIYVGTKNDWLVEMKKLVDGDNVEVKLNFVMGETFLRRIDYFEDVLGSEILYYYDNNFFIETDQLGVDVIYGDSSDLILDEGIKIRN